MIPQRNISLISNTLVTAGGRRIPEAVIERDYVLAWFLTGLAGHPLREVLAFKGGTALRRCWFEDYRFSEDLDFTLTRPITLEKILAGLNEIFATVEADSGLRIAFDREDRHGHQNSHTFYLRYQGPLPAANDVKVRCDRLSMPPRISTGSTASQICAGLIIAAGLSVPHRAARRGLRARPSARPSCLDEGRSGFRQGRQRQASLSSPGPASPASHDWTRQGNLRSRFQRPAPDVP